MHEPARVFPEVFLKGSLPPNRSISNITGWNLAEPTSGEIPRLFYSQKSWNHLNEVQEFRGVLFLEKKAPASYAPHRSPEWGWSPESKYPDIQLSRCPDVRISRYQVSDTRYQVSGIRKIKWTSQQIGFSQKSKISSNEWGKLKLWPHRPLRRPSFLSLFILGVFLENLVLGCIFDSILALRERCWP